MSADGRQRDPRRGAHAGDKCCCLLRGMPAHTPISENSNLILAARTPNIPISVPEIVCEQARAAQPASLGIADPVPRHSAFSLIWWPP